MEKKSLKAIEEALEKALKKAKKPFAVFDFDNTCIINDVSEATLAYLCGHELLRDRGLLGEELREAPDYHERVFRTYHGLLESGKTRAACVLCARIFSRFTPGEAEAATLAAITEEGVRMGSKVLYGLEIERGLAVRSKTLELMKYLRDRGVEISIISAGPEMAVRAAMSHFGIDAALIGSRLLQREGFFTAELIEPVPMFDGKVACIQKYIHPIHTPLLAIGDGRGDLAMLEMATVKVVVDRDNELSKIAHEREWFVI